MAQKRQREEENFYTYYKKEAHRRRRHHSMDTSTWRNARQVLVLHDKVCAEFSSSLSRRSGNMGRTVRGLNTAISIVGNISGGADSSHRKNAIVKLLREWSITLHNDYLQPTRNKVQYVRYMYKTAEFNIPESLKAFINADSKDVKRSIDHRVLEIRKRFQSKPSEQIWEKTLLEEFGIAGINEITIRRSYRNWPTTTNNSLKHLMKTMTKNEDPPMKGTRAYGILKSILSNAAESLYGGKLLSKIELEAYLLYAALEARHGKIMLSPHFLFEGQAGAGKSLVAKLLFPKEIAMIMVNDSKGVGQFELHGQQVAIRVDEAGEHFWGSPEILATIYTMFHNEWSAKVHSTRKDQNATLAFITTNDEDALSHIVGVADEDGAKRRFLVTKFDNKLSHGKKEEITNDTCQELLEIWFKKFDVAAAKKAMYARLETEDQPPINYDEIIQALEKLKGIRHRYPAQVHEDAKAGDEFVHEDNMKREKRIKCIYRFGQRIKRSLNQVTWTRGLWIKSSKLIV
uniref:uncharacterized protein LOC120344078 n=1 Tax=Styela clava TaxID=7725 RepID=UPI00193A565C|nr:uncharacterized protein LOC120344078 [Styela clava]